MDDPHGGVYLFSRRATLGLLAGTAAALVAESRNLAARAKAEEDIEYYARRIKRLPFTDRNVEATVDALALAGIAVYEHATDLLPMTLLPVAKSPLELIYWQVRNMALEVSAGTGVKGSDLDSVFPQIDGIPPISWLLAGYVATAQTPGGELARALSGDIGDRLPPEMGFSALVLDLFVSDVAMDASAPTAGMTLAKLSQPAGVCSAVQKFTDDVLAAIFGALKVDQPKGSSDLLTDIWNWIVGAGESVIEGLADVLTAPVIASIQAITGVIAIGTSISSMLMVWTVHVDTQPPETRFGIEDEFITGKVVASIDAGGQEDWPDELASCAATAGITLPSLQGEGSAITWTISQVPSSLIIEMGKSPLVETNGVAEYIYHTNNESADVAEGVPIEGLVIVELSVERSDIAQLRDNILTILTTNLPAPFGAAVEAVLGPAVVSLTSDLAQVLVKGYGFDTVKVIFHEKQITVTPEPPEPGEPEGSSNTCPGGSWYMSDFGGWFTSLMASFGGAGAVTYLGESGLVVLELLANGTFTSSSLEFEALFTDGTFSYLATLHGSVSGTYAIEEDQIVGIEMSGGMSLTINVQGAIVQELPFGTVGVGSQQFACADGDLLLYPPAPADIPVRWSPYMPD